MFPTRPLLSEYYALSLLHVLRDELGHLKHRNLLLAVEDHFQRVVRVDHRALLGVLQFVLFDVFPQFLCERAACERLGAHDE